MLHVSLKENTGQSVLGRGKLPFTETDAGLLSAAA